MKVTNSKHSPPKREKFLKKIRNDPAQKIKIRRRIIGIYIAPLQKVHNRIRQETKYNDWGLENKNVLKAVDTIGNYSK